MAGMWEFDPQLGRGHLDLAGFDVVATDGPVGRIHAASDRPGAAFVVVDIGASPDGARRLLPAGLVRLVNENDRVVHVSLTRDEIMSAPRFDDDDLESPDLSYDVFFQRFVP